MTTRKLSPAEAAWQEEALKLAPTSMTAQEFEDSRDKFYALTLQTVDLARLVLVEGKGLTAAAALLGMSKQSANGAMNRVRAALVGVPNEWVLYQGMMSKEMAVKVRAEVNAELEKWKGEK
jgi:hypothetical protein